MQVSATTKFARISPKKVRPLLKDLRGKKVVLVLNSLKFSTNKSGLLLYRLIHSAMANATNNYNLKSDNLKIKTLTVDDGPRYRRYWFRSHGSADIRLKRTAHLKVMLEEVLPTLRPVSAKQPSVPTVATQPTVSAPAANSDALPTESRLHSTDTKKTRGRTGIKKIFSRRTTNK